jgi:hypothetical protein
VGRVPLYFCFITFHLFSYFRIDLHATLVAPDEDENTYPGIVSPFSKGGKGDLNYLLFRHSEERLMRRENLIL